MSQEFLFAVAYASIGSVLIPIAFALANGKRLPAELKPLRWILFISLSCDLVSLGISLTGLMKNTHWIGNLYMILQFSFLILIFRRQLQSNRIIDIVHIVFVLFYVVNISVFQGPWIFNSVTNAVACIILIVITMYYFYRLLNDLPTDNIQSLPMLWLSFAVLVYYAGNFFLFLAANYLTYGGVEGTHLLMWNLHNLLNIIKNILFAIALWQSYRKVRLSTLSSSAP